MAWVSTSLIAALIAYYLGNAGILGAIITGILVFAVIPAFGGPPTKLNKVDKFFLWPCLEDMKEGTMEAKLVLHHNIESCQKRLDDTGYCPECMYSPVMESAILYYYCPTHDVKLKNMVCPVCEETFSKPTNAPCATCRKTLRTAN